MDDERFLWAASWAWGLPLIVLNVVIHVAGLTLIGARVNASIGKVAGKQRTAIWAILTVSATTLRMTILHGLEAGTWAMTYRLIGAFSEYRTAMLYSLGALTSYGHARIYLEGNWGLMGALEALNGLMLLGLSTAFLYAVIQKVRPFHVDGGGRGTT
jgi:hypothetical protein